MKREVIQQGDVLFIPVDKIPNNTRKVNSNKYHILAIGEATGHSHKVAVEEADFLRTDCGDQSFLNVIEGAVIMHEEHKTAVLPAGIWEVKIVREYDYDKEQAKKISD